MTKVATIRGSWIRQGPIAVAALRVIVLVMVAMLLILVLLPAALGAA
jgi:hypothetical protein